MEKIEDDNARDLCDEHNCPYDYEYFEKIELRGMKIIIKLCRKHKEEWEWKKN